MSALYCTINDCVAKNKPTGRGHRSIAATVKDWNHAIEVALEAADSEQNDTLAVITIRNVRTGESYEIACGEMEELFAAAKARSKRNGNEESILTRALLNPESSAFAKSALA